MAEVLAEQALVRPQIIPLVPLTNQYRHQDHMDHKDYKSKVRRLTRGCVCVLAVSGLQSCFCLFQPDKMEVPRQKRKYEKKQKVLPLSSGGPHHHHHHHQGPAVFNAKDLNQYDFPSSDDEPFSQVPDPTQVWRLHLLLPSNLGLLFTAAFRLIRGRRGERPRRRLRLPEESGLPVLRCESPRSCPSQWWCLGWLDTSQQRNWFCWE